MIQCYENTYLDMIPEKKKKSTVNRITKTNQKGDGDICYVFSH